MALLLVLCASVMAAQNARDKSLAVDEAIASPALQPFQQELLEKLKQQVQNLKVDSQYPDQMKAEIRAVIASHITIHAVHYLMRKVLPEEGDGVVDFAGLAKGDPSALEKWKAHSQEVTQALLSRAEQINSNGIKSATQEVLHDHPEWETQFGAPVDPVAEALTTADVQPTILFKVEPEYTEEARKKKHIQGSVTLNLVVGTDGIPGDITVVKSLDPGLDQKAVEAVGKWRFKPGTKNGVPVAVRANVVVNFRLLTTPPQ